MERNRIEPTVIGSYNIKAIYSINIKPSSKLERLEKEIESKFVPKWLLNSQRETTLTA